MSCIYGSVKAPVHRLITVTVLHYFANSHFSDQTSNNAILISQAQYDQELATIVSTGDGFEKHLTSMSGLEYLLVPDPVKKNQPSQPSSLPPQGTAADNGVWVIRKQQRQPKSGGADEIKILANYLILNGVITKLPTVGSILGARLTSSLLSLNKSLVNITNLPHFSPSEGYTYIPSGVPLPEPSLPAQDENSIQVPALRFSPPPEAQDGAVTPSQNQELASMNSSPLSIRRSQALSSTASLSNKRDMSVDDLFVDSWRMMKRHKGIFMDKHPLVGEPGTFRVKGMKEDLTATKALPRPMKAAGLRAIKS